MTSLTLQRIVEKLDADRRAAGVTTNWLDVAATRQSMRPNDLPLPANTRIIPVKIDGVSCFWVVTPTSNPARRVVYFHGGAFVAGGLHSHRALVAWLSHYAGAAVLFVDYSLAPEHRFPTAIVEGSDAVSAAFTTGFDGSRKVATVLVAGDSCGAALAAGVLLYRRDQRAPMPAGGCFLCGMFDLDEQTSAYLQMSQRNRDCVRLYVNRLADLANPLASPMRASLSGLPPLFLQAGGGDYLKEDSLRFADRANAAEVSVRLEMWPEMIHVWQRFAPTFPEATAALEQAGEWLRRTSNA